MSASFISNDTFTIPSIRGEVQQDVQELEKSRQMNTTFDQSLMAQAKQDARYSKDGKCAKTGYPNWPSDWMISESSLAPNQVVSSLDTARPGLGTPFDFAAPFLGGKDMPANPIDEYYCQKAHPMGVTAPYDALQGIFDQADPFVNTASFQNVVGPDTGRGPTEAPFAAPEPICHESKNSIDSFHIEPNLDLQEITPACATATIKQMYGGNGNGNGNGSAQNSILAPTKNSANSAKSRNARSSNSSNSSSTSPSTIETRMSSTRPTVFPGSRLKSSLDLQNSANSKMNCVLPSNIFESIKAAYTNSVPMPMHTRILYISAPIVVILLVILVIGFGVVVARKRSGKK
jgi:hypothetical protein